jgi:2-dehydro-3-deoxyphosphogluconate aldolase/(4S)-4-hydroxy-2-oxoglutarate aldolase
MTIDATLDRATVIPVIEIDDAALAVDLAGALQEGGIDVIELTLRTEAGLPALAAIKQQCPDVVTGMGTVLSVDDADRAMGEGAGFLVSPGITPSLLAHAAKENMPLLPGVATSGELMQVLEHGFTAAKFFPAEAAGGAKYLKAFSGPFAKVRFCPTGGISLANMNDYLALPQVACMGGSWVASRAAINERDWAGITARAAEALAAYKAVRG